MSTTTITIIEDNKKYTINFYPSNINIMCDESYYNIDIDYILPTFGDQYDNVDEYISSLQEYYHDDNIPFSVYAEAIKINWSADIERELNNYR